MEVSVRTTVERYAILRVALAALAGVAACVAGLLWRQDRLGGLPLLGSRTRYTPADATALFEALDRLDANARAVYAATGLTIDMVFPTAYGLLFTILLIRLFRAPFFLLPLATAAADVLENATVAVLALDYAGAPSPLAWLAAAFTLLKALFGYAALAAFAGCGYAGGDGARRPGRERCLPRGDPAMPVFGRRRQHNCEPFHGRMPPTTARCCKRCDYRGRDAGCPTPPAQIRTCPLGHPAPPLGSACGSADGKASFRPRVPEFQSGPT